LHLFVEFKGKKIRTFVADIADAKVLCNKVVSMMSGKVAFELPYKTKTYHSFFTNKPKKWHSNIYYDRQNNSF
jgi:hypothetical protein